jgi:hypothetical protein
MGLLRCESCKLTYSQRALFREMALTTGVACRRCGGTLREAEPGERRFDRRPSVAVRSAVTGEERLPFG